MGTCQVLYADADRVLQEMLEVINSPPEKRPFKFFPFYIRPLPFTVGVDF